MSKSIQPIDQLIPGKDIDAYIQSISTIAILSHEEEKSIAKRLFEEHDLEAARQLVMSHLRFVVHIARNYKGYGLPMCDLIQEGNIGLMKAVKRFNPSVGVRLMSFAVHWIKAEIHEFIIKNWRIVKIATTKAQRKLFFNLRSSKSSLNWLTQNEIKNVAKDLGVEPKLVSEMESRMTNKDSTFDGHKSGDETNSDPVNYFEDHRYDPAKLIEDKNLEESNYKNLSKALEKLDDRSRDILRKRWLNEKKSTLHELADQYQISAERIRQLEQNAIKKIRHCFLKKLS